MSVALRGFVRQTLEDIIGGAADVEGDNVVPKGIGSGKYPGASVSTIPRRGALIAVSFDVAVAAETGDAVKGGSRVKVAVLGAGADGEVGTTSKNVAVTRIQFEVPVLLPARG